MFNNIGSKIKALAKVICWLGIIASAVGGIAYIISMSRLYNQSMMAVIIVFLAGLIIAAVGALVSWLSTFILYGFGELIEKVSSIEENIPQIESIASAILSESRKIGTSSNAEQE